MAVWTSQASPNPAPCPSPGPPPCPWPCRKVSKAYFALLEVLCHGHTATIANTDAATFNYILTSLDQVSVASCECVCVGGRGATIGKGAWRACHAAR